MSDLRALYQEVIFDHYRKPRNYHVMEDPDYVIEGVNPLCGDKLKLFFKISADRVNAMSFQGEGCAISIASASIMSQILIGKLLQEVDAYYQYFHDLVLGLQPFEPHLDEIEKLQVLSGVCEFPARVKCATLAWHAAHNITQGSTSPVTTE